MPTPVFWPADIKNSLSQSWFLSLCFTFYLQSISKFCLFYLSNISCIGPHVYSPLLIHWSSPPPSLILQTAMAFYPGSLSCFSCHSSHSDISESVSAQGRRSELPHLGLTLKSAVWPPDSAKHGPRYFPSLYSASLPLCPLSVSATLTFLILLALALARPWVPSLIILCLAAFLNFFDFLFKCHSSSEKCPRITPSRVSSMIGTFTHHSFLK